MPWTHSQATLLDGAGAPRRVFAACPASHLDSGWVLYCADGETTVAFAESVAETSPDCLPTLIGVESSAGHRAEEYLHGTDHRFGVLADFFTAKLPAWAESSLGVGSSVSRSAVFGFSNGGSFAIAMVMLHPDQYQAAIALSPTTMPTLPCVPGGLSELPRVYCSAGTVGPEKSVRKQAMRAVKGLRRLQFDVTWSEAAGGHDFALWSPEFAKALRWLQEPMQ